MVECLTRDLGPQVRASPTSLCCVLEQDRFYPSLVLIQPRKIHPYIAERLLMGRKESNKNKKTKLDYNGIAVKAWEMES